MFVKPEASLLATPSPCLNSAASTTGAVMTAYALRGLNRHDRRREKVFGSGNPRPLTRNLKLRLMKLARAKMLAREPGQHWGEVKAKHLQVFAALLWGFHNAKTGLC